jgi:hypothetical protein
MRLLTHDDNGKLVLRVFDDNALPTYAILSHTWHTDNSKEVTFQDLEANKAKDKDGYSKILFCESWAAADGLHYFWIDTCCINRRSETELSEAINSMFRWYQGSAKCYVYLSDVSYRTSNEHGKRMPLSWEKAFQTSRWFTRGWTLQELIAPRVVEFYAADGSQLGDRTSLEASLYEATKVAIKALRGHPLSDFGIEERFSWASGRQTKRPEDKAYSLLGILGVSMPLIYGEGEGQALHRLRELVERPKK